MFDFPNTPVSGQIYTAPNGAQYIWNGIVWLQAPSAASLTAERRNRLVNPALQISQENGTTSSASVAALSGYYAADQWACGWNLPGTAACQLLIGNYMPNGHNCVQLVAATASASLVASSYALTTQQSLEGVKTADFRWGSAGALPAVLRFNCYSTIAATFSVAVRNGDVSRTYLAPFTVAAAQWKVFTFAIPGDTTGTWATDGSAGISVGIGLAAGTTYQGVAGWQAGNKVQIAGNTNGMAAANNIFYVGDFGLYLDASSTGLAPPYEVPDYLDEYNRCLRYLSYTSVGTQCPAVQSIIVPWYAPQPMRTGPTLSIQSAGSGANATAQQDAVTDNRSGYFQIGATVAGGYLLNRVYKLNARM